MKRAARRPISFASCRYRGLLARKVSRLSGPNPPMPSYDADTAARRRLAIYLLEKLLVRPALNTLPASGEIGVYICSIAVGGGLNRRTT
jgi:hypothetical protein